MRRCRLMMTWKRLNRSKTTGPGLSQTCKEEDKERKQTFPDSTTLDIKGGKRSTRESDKLGLRKFVLGFAVVMEPISNPGKLLWRRKIVVRRILIKWFYHRVRKRVKPLGAVEMGSKILSVVYDDSWEVERTYNRRSTRGMSTKKNKMKKFYSNEKRLRCCKIIQALKLINTPAPPEEDSPCPQAATARVDASTVPINIQNLASLSTSPELPVVSHPLIPDVQQLFSLSIPLQRR
uniref:Uncharacterized protein n=1 Tax=Brassica campestris TaxID=3711 RepID=M4F0C4_BRACM